MEALFRILNLADLILVIDEVPRYGTQLPIKRFSIAVLLPKSFEISWECEIRRKRFLQSSKHLDLWSK